MSLLHLVFPLPVLALPTAAEVCSSLVVLGWGCACDFLERFSLCCFPMQHLPGPVGLPKAAAMFVSGLYNGCHDPAVTYAKPSAWRKQEHPAWER